MGDFFDQIGGFEERRPVPKNSSTRFFAVGDTDLDIHIKHALDLWGEQPRLIVPGERIPAETGMYVEPVTGLTVYVQEQLPVEKYVVSVVAAIESTPKSFTPNRARFGLLWQVPDAAREYAHAMTEAIRNQFLDSYRFEIRADQECSPVVSEVLQELSGHNS